jgi:hypothetical protein
MLEKQDAPSACPANAEICREASDLATTLIQHIYDPTLSNVIPDRYAHWGPLSDLKAFNNAVNYDLQEAGITPEQMHIDLGLNNNSCRPGQYITMWTTLQREGFQDTKTSVGRHYIDLPYCF